MADNAIPPLNGDDDADGPDAFDEFVNRHLNFEQQRASDDLFDDDDDVRDESFLTIENPFSASERPLRRPDESSASGARPKGPVGQGGKPIFGQAVSASPPPRVPLPSSDDRRWVRGLYMVRGDMEIYYAQPFLAMRVLVLAEANRRWNKQIRYIPNIAPGWAAIEIQTARTLRGFVRQADVRLMPMPKAMNPRTLFGALPVEIRIWNHLDAILLVLALAVIVYALANWADLNFAARPHIDTLEMQVATQQAQITELAGQLDQQRSGNDAR